MRRLLLTLLSLLCFGGAVLADTPGLPEEPSEPRKVAALKLDRIQEAVALVTKLYEVAVDGDDIVRANCLADVLLQLKEILGNAEHSYTLYLEADVRGDAESATYLTRLLGLASRADVLAAEAEACVGDEGLFLGETSTTVDEPGDVDDADPGQPAIPDFEPPPLASPFV